MSIQTIDEIVVLETVECCSCGTTFAVSKRFVDRRREDGKTFYCPSGHYLCFDGSTEKLKKELEEKSRALTQTKCALADEQRLRESERMEAERLRKSADRRARHGVCPCCHKTVSQMARHMASKHPDFANEGKPPGRKEAWSK